MARNTAGILRKNVQEYVRQNVPDEFIRAWEKLRDDHDRLTNFKTAWTRAYYEHCANVYDEEQRVVRIDQAQNTDKHVRALWLTLGVKHESARTKIRSIAERLKALPQRERDTIMAQIPATKEAMYVAASYPGNDLAKILDAKAINPDWTTSQFRAVLGKATPQDRNRNARRTTSTAKAHYRVAVVCRTREAMTELVAFVKSRSRAYVIESAPATNE